MEVTKMTKKTSRTAGSTDVEQLRELLDAEVVRLSEEFDPNRRQTTSRTVLMWFAELRKAETAAARRLEKVTRPLVISWARTLNKEERRSVVKELMAMDAGGSVLA